MQHRAALRAGCESVRRYAHQLPLLHGAEDDVHQVLSGVHHLPGWVWYPRRAVRGVDAHPDGKDLPVPRHSDGTPLLGWTDPLAAIARAAREKDLARGHGPHPHHG